MNKQTNQLNIEVGQMWHLSNQNSFEMGVEIPRVVNPRASIVQECFGFQMVALHGGDCDVELRQQTTAFLFMQGKRVLPFAMSHLRIAHQGTNVVLFWVHHNEHSPHKVRESSCMANARHERKSFVRPSPIPHQWPMSCWNHRKSLLDVAG
jgi:hypothetical protein